VASVTTERANGSARPAVVDLPERVGSRRLVRTPELAVGLVVVVGCALAATLVFLQADRKSPAAAFASSVRAGEVIERADLRVVYVSSDGDLATTSPQAAAGFIGKRAVRDISKGSLLTADVVSGGEQLAAGEGVVGVAVAASAVPSSSLAVGDTVNVVASGSAESASDAVLVEGAVVHGLEKVDADGGLVVSLRTSVAAANRIAAAEPTKLRLVLVGR
jgi:hypothetical protein